MRVGSSLEALSTPEPEYMRPGLLMARRVGSLAITGGPARHEASTAAACASLGSTTSVGSSCCIMPLTTSLSLRCPKMYGASTAAAASVAEEQRMERHTVATSIPVRCIASGNDLCILQTATSTGSDV
eukprot:CAMPEP_0119069852 /NCGR_PEP_ID=MMETSP1178-20130426/30474_1 /TAXON_ID=33656 /ORGANISM="unid sp, Strain CCMP2000" /LENGTH=127 /DNA_ID=CAMNT_0007051651 /DNA_START=65 /DNA_END=450 /DNA_ORIENTATION=-